MTTKRDILEKLSKGEITQEEADQQMSAINDPAPEDSPANSSAQAEATPTPSRPPKRSRAGCVIAVIASVAAGILLVAVIALLVGLFLFQSRTKTMMECERMQRDEMKEVYEVQKRHMKDVYQQLEKELKAQDEQIQRQQAEFQHILKDKDKKIQELESEVRRLKNKR